MRSFQVRFIRMSETEARWLHLSSPNIEEAIAVVRKQYPGCLIFRVEATS